MSKPDIHPLLPAEREKFINDCVWVRNALFLCGVSGVLYMWTSVDMTEITVFGGGGILASCLAWPFHITLSNLKTGQETHFDVNLMRQMNLPGLLHWLPLHRVLAPKKPKTGGNQ